MMEINENNFDTEVLKSEVPVVIDFWAEWCGPCKIFSPTLEEVSKEYAGKVKFAKLNIDENMRIAQEYGIMSIPTVLMFERGSAKAQNIGAIPKESLKDWVSENLNLKF